MPKPSKSRSQRPSPRKLLLERSRELRADIARELRKYDSEHYADLAERMADSGEQSVADLERLEAAPSVARCLPCQQRHERQRHERQRPGDRHPTL